MFYLEIVPRPKPPISVAKAFSIKVMHLYSKRVESIYVFLAVMTHRITNSTICHYKFFDVTDLPHRAPVYTAFSLLNSKSFCSVRCLSITTQIVPITIACFVTKRMSRLCNQVRYFYCPKRKCTVYIRDPKQP